MAIKIKFDAANNPENPTFVLAKRNGDKIGKVNTKAIEVSDNMNDASEVTFTVYKYIDGRKDTLWDSIVNFKLLHCVEWDKWFEIIVEVDESNETVKTVFATSLGHAELSQIMLYDIQINTDGDDGDIAREDYVIPTVLYRENGVLGEGITESDVKFYKEVCKEDMKFPFEYYKEASLLHRILKDKAPHYSIAHVDETVRYMQRTFEFDDTSIYDACQEIAEELNCLFVFDSCSDDNGNIQRTISVYDLESNCNSCGYRGEFIDVCPECGGIDIDDGYGDDTMIFVTSDEIADNIQLETDTESIKNCFKLEAGDDLMTATIRNCNPNGTDYIWHLSDDMKADMSRELVARIEEYDQLYEEYKTRLIDIDESVLSEYNSLVKKYRAYNEALETIDVPIEGFPSLINAYYNTFDLYLYLQSGLMPSINIARPSISDEISKLTTANLSPVAVNVATNSTADPLKACSVSTADNLVLQMAKTIVDSRYKVKIADGSTLTSYTNSTTPRTWKGKFVLTAYSDEDVTATTNLISVSVNADYETFVRRKLDKALSDEDAEDVSISGLFKKNLIADLENGETKEDSFEHALKEYSLNRLKSFYDACQACIDIMIEMGVADGETWGNAENADLYADLYTPYYNKLSAIRNEITVRDEEIALIAGLYDEDGELKTAGLQNIIEDKKAKIQNALDFETFLGNELWLEFCSFRREDKYSNDNYISEGLNNAELITKANEFIQVAQKEIYKSAELQCSISAGLKNLLVIDKFKPLVNSFKVGNWLRVMVDDNLYRLRLTNYEIDYDNLDEISVEFSDVTKANSSIKKVKGAIDQASSMATSYSAVKRQAKQGEESKSVINDWVSTGLDATNVKIMGGADGQTQTWDSHGMLFREYDSSTETYSPEQMKIINSTMAITDDNWKTTKTAVGKYYYVDSETGESKVAYGINAETIIGKLILGETIALKNDDGTLSFDENGLVVKNGNKVVTISPHKEEVINIVNGDESVFVVDEDGELTINGNIMARSLSLSSGVTIDSGVITDLAIVAVTGNYDDLANKPSLATVATSGKYSDLSGKPSLSAVATSGSYSDLSNKPSLATVATSGNYSDLSGKPSLSTVATSGKYSDLTATTSDAGKLLYINDNGGVTSIDIDDLKTLLGI